MLRYLWKYAKRVSVTEPEESDKWQLDGIAGEASVDVAIGGNLHENSDQTHLVHVLHHWYHTSTDADNLYNCLWSTIVFRPLYFLYYSKYCFVYVYQVSEWKTGSWL